MYLPQIYYIKKAGILDIVQLGDVASFASDEPNKAKPPHIRQKPKAASEASDFA